MACSHWMLGLSILSILTGMIWGLCATFNQPALHNMPNDCNETIIDELLYGNGTEGSGLIGDDVVTPDGDFVKWDTDFIKAGTTQETIEGSFNKHLNALERLNEVNMEGTTLPNPLDKADIASQLTDAKSLSTHLEDEVFTEADVRDYIVTGRGEHLDKLNAEAAQKVGQEAATAIGLGGGGACAILAGIAKCNNKRRLATLNDRSFPAPWYSGLSMSRMLLFIASTIVMFLLFAVIRRTIYLHQAAKQYSPFDTNVDPVLGYDPCLAGDIV